jgi:hypothetical protein
LQSRDRIHQDAALNQGWQVAFAGLGVNLALGILYAWSVFARFLRDDLGWTATASQLPYMIACGVFALLMVPGGRIQDKIGPRFVIMAAAVFAGLGMIGSSFFLSVTGLSIFLAYFSERPWGSVIHQPPRPPLSGLARRNGAWLRGLLSVASVWLLFTPPLYQASYCILSACPRHSQYWEALFSF